MISKNEAKHLRSLSNKKQRRLSGQFLVQGEKNVLELLRSGLMIEKLFVSDAFVAVHSNLLINIAYTIANEDELTKVSSITSNNAAIAIVKQPEYDVNEISGLVLALDDVNDPGNLGTILRLADWYGVKHVLLSEQTADVYNPKTISATMGAFTRVQTYRVDLVHYLANTKAPIYGAFLEGESVHHCAFKEPAIIVMGNESHGISKEIENLVTDKITIPSYGQSESLNVAMATGIILDNYRRTT